MPKTDMSKKTLNKPNLEALGASALADLLFEIAEGSADIKRRLRLELSHGIGPAELAHDIRKRLISLQKAKTSVSWRKRKALVKDLQGLGAMIIDKLGADDPGAAFDLLWQFLELAPAIAARVDDSRGEVAEVFEAARDQIAELSVRAGLDGVALADRVWAALCGDRLGTWTGIIPQVAAALGTAGLARLKTVIEAETPAPKQAPKRAPKPAMNEPATEPAAIRFLRELRDEFGGETGAAATRKARLVKTALRDIATATGDADAYIAQFSKAERARPSIAAEIAGRLLAQDRAEAALEYLHAASPDPQTATDPAWDAAYVNALTALGRSAELAAYRTACFRTRLSVDHLRDHLKTLPDFDDVEAEDRARQHVLAFPDLSAALEFCLIWPDHVTAAHLISTRAEDLRGDDPILPRVAEALRARHSLATVILWRAIIDDTLDWRRTGQYAAAADYFAQCAAMDAQITDYGRFLPHDRYKAALRIEHDRKSSFWAVVS